MKIYESNEFRPRDLVEVGFAMGMWLGANTMVLTGRDGKPVSRLARRELTVGLAAAGVSILDMRIVPRRVVVFETWKHSLAGGVHVSCDGTSIAVHAFSASGKEVGERDLARINEHRQMGVFAPVDLEEMGTILFYPNGIDDYTAMITRKVKTDRQIPVSVFVDCRNEPYALFAPGLFGRYGMRTALFNDRTWAAEPAAGPEEFRKALSQGVYDRGILLSDDDMAVFSRDGTVLRSGLFMEELLEFMADSANVARASGFPGAGAKPGLPGGHEGGPRP